MAEKVISFDEWHEELVKIAKEHDVSWLIPSKKDYPRDAFEDGITPKDAFWDEVSYAVM